MKTLVSLQYIRALAVLLILVLHASLRTGEALFDWGRAHVDLLNIGVDMFFVVSGFIMWVIGSRAGESPGLFLLRRAIRILPLFWIAILSWAFLIQIGLLGWITLNAENLLKSLLFIPHYHLDQPGRIWPIMIPGWTLTYEAFFYVFFTAILFVPPRLRLPALVLSMGVLVALGFILKPEAALPYTYTSPLLLEFLGGCLVGALWQAAPGRLVRNLTLLMLSIALFVWLGPQISSADYADRALAFGLPAVLFVSAIVGLEPYLPQMRPLEKIGDASYSIYLFHLFLLDPMLMVWVRVPALHTPTTAIVFVLIGAVLATLMGLLIARHIEYPLLGFLKRHLITGRRRPVEVQ
jgi:exopolysaccharide production protein ExoZ